jgi:hypothetical protein
MFFNRGTLSSLKGQATRRAAIAALVNVKHVGKVKPLSAERVLCQDARGSNSSNKIATTTTILNSAQVPERGRGMTLRTSNS